MLSLSLSPSSSSSDITVQMNLPPGCYKTMGDSITPTPNIWIVASQSFPLPPGMPESLVAGTRKRSCVQCSWSLSLSVKSLLFQIQWRYLPSPPHADYTGVWGNREGEMASLVLLGLEIIPLTFLPTWERILGPKSMFSLAWGRKLEISKKLERQEKASNGCWQEKKIY